MPRHVAPAKELRYVCCSSRRFQKVYPALSCRSNRDDSVACVADFGREGKISLTRRDTSSRHFRAFEVYLSIALLYHAARDRDGGVISEGSAL
jgi:hypothetical protein